MKKQHIGPVRKVWRRGRHRIRMWSRRRGRFRLFLVKTSIALWVRPRVRRSGVPVIAVTGTCGKSTVVRMLHRILLEAGYRVGMACSDGVAKSDRWIARGDYAGFDGLSRAVRGEPVDVVVAETARGGILRYGFGFDTCRAGVVTNVSEDHLGLGGVATVDQMADVKARLVERVSPGGTAVLNLDDPRVRRMTPPEKARTVYFSLAETPAEISDCFFSRGGFLWKRSRGVEERLIPADGVRFARRGLLPYHVANALAVLAALDGVRDALPVDLKVAASVLLRFGEDVDDHPFSFRLVDYKGRRVLFTEAKNPASFRLDCDAIRRLRHSLGVETVVGILTHGGNRQRSFHRKIGSIAAEFCDRVVAVPPKARFLRGVAWEDLASRLLAGVPPEKRLEHGADDLESFLETLDRRLRGETLYAIFLPREQGFPDLPRILRQGQPIEP